MGLINRAFDTSTEMYAHIDNLASCPVLFPLRSLGVAKRSINQATRPPPQGTATSNQSDSYGEQFLGGLACKSHNNSEKSHGGNLVSLSSIT